MGKPEDYVERIAALATAPRKIDDKITAGVEALDELDPKLLQDDAVTHFGCQETERNRQVDFLKEIRKGLEPRYGEVTSLGHNPSHMNIVGIDKLLKNLDLLLDVGRVAEVRKLIVDKLKDVCEPATLLPAVDACYAKAVTAIGEIETAFEDWKLTGLQDKLDEFGVLHQALKTELAKIGHARLRLHLESLLLAPADKFAAGTICRDLKEALANRFVDGFRNAWNEACKLAEKRFEKLTGSKGKPLPLSTAIKIDPKLDQALEQMEKKAEGSGTAGTTVEQLGTSLLESLEQLPEKLKNAVPDFTTPLRSTMMSIVMSVKDDK